MRLEAAILPSGVDGAPKAGDRDPKKVRETAQQFESLLISSMLKSTRESGNSWLGMEGDSASESAVSMAEDEFAKALSSQGGLGLASLVEQGLSKAPAPKS